MKITKMNERGFDHVLLIVGVVVVVAILGTGLKLYSSAQSSSRGLRPKCRQSI